MEVSADVKSDLVTNIADVRHTPLDRLAQRAGAGKSLSRVLSGSGSKPAAVAVFQSSI